MSIEDNVATATSYFERIAAGDVDGALALLEDDGTWWSNLNHHEIPIRDLKPGVRSTLSKMPFRFRIVRTIAAGDDVVLEVMSDAETPEGEPYHNVYCFLMTVKGGRILGIRHYVDTAAAGRIPPSARSISQH
jgi:ketosteroid isomerase-like protein